MPSADSESNEPAPLRPRPAPPAPLPPAPAAPGVADLLLLVRAMFGEGPPVAPPAGGKPGQLVAPGQARGPLPKEQKKFYKLGNPPPAPSAPVTGPAPAPPREPGPVREAPAPNPAAPAREAEFEADWAEKLSPSAPAAEHAPVRPVSSPVPMEERTPGRRRSLTGRQRVLLIALGISSAVASFLVGLFLGWLGRPTVPKKPVPGPAAAQTQTQPVAATLAARVLAPDEGLRRALVTIDEAEAAHAAGDLARMDALLEQAGREGGPRGVPGLTFHRAENAVRRGDLNAANTMANSVLEAGEDVAKAYALRAVIAQRSKRPEVALPLLEAAGRADPFESRYLFYQAQSLRAQGKLQEAVARLRRALDRVEEPAVAESYRLALRLAQVELGEDAAFGEELTRRLAEPNPAPDWLVTAAARDCQAGRFREGAEFLRRAFAQAGPGYAAARLGDVFFRPFSARPEIAALFAQYLPAPPAAPAPAPASASSAPTPGSLMPAGESLVAPLPLFEPGAAPSPAGAAKAATPQP